MKKPGVGLNVPSSGLVFMLYDAIRSDLRPYKLKVIYLYHS